MASKQEIQAGRAFVRLFLKNDMSRQLVRVLRNAQAKLRQFGQSAMATGRQVVVAGALMAAPFVFATRTFAEFDDAMREVKGVTQAVGADFDMLTDKAKKLGASTSFTAIEVALLMAELGRAGFVPKQIDEMTGSVLSLARATKTEGAEAAGIMATAIRQFGLEASDASRVADVLTTAANKSFNTLEMLGESLKFVGPVAADFNMSLEDTVAVLGTLGNVGIQGSMAGTTMRRILLATGAEAKRLKKIFGVEFVDINGNARPLVDTLDDIATATRDLGSAERAQKFKDAFGLRGITGASAIGKNITGTRELRDAIAKAGGIAKKTADDMDAGLGGAFRILLSSIEGVKIEIGAALAPVLQKLAKLVTKTAQSIIEWIKANKGMVIAAAATAAGVIVLGVALMTLGAAALVASFGVGALASIIAVVTSPLGILVAAVVGGTAAWFAFSESGKRAWTSLRATVIPIIETLKAAFGGIKDAIASGDWRLAGKIAMVGLKLAFLQGLSEIQQAFPRTFNATLRVVAKFADGIVMVWNKVTVFLTEQWSKAIGFLTKQWNNWGKQTLETVIDVVGRMTRIWQASVAGMAAGFRDAAAKGGIKGKGKAISKIFGVDTSEEQARGAREALKQYTDSLVANAAALGAALGAAPGAEPGEGIAGGTISASLESFLAELGSGTAIGDLTNELEALRKEAADRQVETATTPGGGAPVVGGGAPVSGGGASAVSAVPRGVALTATYSAAAARISGFQPRGPEKKMAAGIDRIADNTAKLLAANEQFLAGWKVS